MFLLIVPLFLRSYLEFSRDVTSHSFENLHDHFDVNNHEKFAQRYYQNLDYSGPQFSTAIVYIGGESPLSSSSITNGSIVELAKRLNASIYSLEHRYFGESQLFNELTRENLRLLTIDQALADLANFIDRIIVPHAKPNAELRIAVVGGSYPGSLSSWFRLKYPHIAYASWASSAPVLIKNNFSEYDKYIADQLELVSSDCLSKTKEVLDMIREKIMNENERKHVIDDFGFDGSEDDISILYAITDALAAMVQYNSRYQLLETHCKNQQSYPNYAGIVDIVKKICQLRNETIKDFNLMMANDTNAHGPYSSSRAWSYMTCTQVGWFQTASGKLRSSTINLDYFQNVCSELFGIDTLPDEKEMNRYFGSDNPKQTKVFFLNGDVDPWSVMGVHQEDMSLLRRAILIQNESHCADLTFVSQNDASPLSNAKNEVISQMVEWLTEDNCNGSCVHGRCAINGCICESEWGGDKCDIKIVKKERFDYAIICGVSVPVFVATFVIFGVWIYSYKIKKIRHPEL